MSAIVKQLAKTATKVAKKNAGPHKKQPPGLGQILEDSTQHELRAAPSVLDLPPFERAENAFNFLRDILQERSKKAKEAANVGAILSQRALATLRTSQSTRNPLADPRLIMDLVRIADERQREKNRRQPTTVKDTDRRRDRDRRATTGLVINQPKDDQGPRLIPIPPPDIWEEPPEEPSDEPRRIPDIPKPTPRKPREPRNTPELENCEKTEDLLREAGSDLRLNCGSAAHAEIRIGGLSIGKLSKKSRTNDKAMARHKKSTSNKNA